MSNEQIIRRAYELAEKVDVKGWVECFTSDGTFDDMSIGVTCSLVPTMDRAMGPFLPLWYFLESITYVLST
jgi:hypothetical protein